jgi:lipoprotein-releasing system permease protein
MFLTDLGLAQELMEYNQSDFGIEIKQKTGSDENAIVDKLQTIFKNKITVKIELNSMKLSIKC